MTIRYTSDGFRNKGNENFRKLPLTTSSNLASVDDESLRADNVL